MIDRTIPYKNIIMICEEYPKDRGISLPSGYSFKFYEDGDELRWAEIQLEIGEFSNSTRQEVVSYFKETYFPHRDQLYERCVFVMNPEKEAIGTCIAWFDDKQNHKVSSIHWLAVKSTEEGRGIGKALTNQILQVFERLESFPVYLHTQPWSYRAIKLYVDEGFQIQIKDSFSSFENEYGEAIVILEKYMHNLAYTKLIATAK